MPEEMSFRVDWNRERSAASLLAKNLFSSINKRPFIFLSSFQTLFQTLSFRFSASTIGFTLTEARLLTALEFFETKKDDIPHERL